MSNKIRVNLFVLKTSPLEAILVLGHDSFAFSSNPVLINSLSEPQTSVLSASCPHDLGQRGERPLSNHLRLARCLLLTQTLVLVSGTAWGGCRWIGGTSLRELRSIGRHEPQHLLLQLRVDLIRNDHHVWKQLTQF
jgi:hypothetical protein